MWRFAWAALICFVVSCGGPSSGTTGNETNRKKVVEQRKELKPFDVKDAQKVPYQAVILGTDKTGGSTVIELAGKPNTSEVDVMWVRMERGKDATGGSTKTKLTTSPQDDGAVRVGIYEQYSGGLGPQWRSSVWVGAFLASTMLGKDMTDFKFTADAEGFIDGPSAGALITAGFLSSLTGDEIQKTATMTGTVNPDGTVGPVGGIPQKFEASAKAGKKVLGYPVGLRRSLDLNTGKYVDLEKLAKKHGAVAVEVRDVYEAYELLTGRKLPTPVPLDPKEMSLDSDVEDRITHAYEAWRKEVSDKWSAMMSIQSGLKVPKGLEALATEAANEAAEAEKLFNQGMLPSAYDRITRAAILARTAYTTLRIIKHMHDGETDKATELLKVGDTEQELATVIREAAKVKANTIGGHLHMMSAFQEAIAGWGFNLYTTQVVPEAQYALYRIAGDIKNEKDSVQRSNEERARAIEAAKKAEEEAAKKNKKKRRKHKRKNKGKKDEPAAAPPPPPPPMRHYDGLAQANKIVEEVMPAVLVTNRAKAYVQLTRDRIAIESVDSLDYVCSLPSVERLATSYSSAASANIKYFDALLLKDVARAMFSTEDRARAFLMRREPDYLVAAMAFAMHQNPTGATEKLKDEWGENSLAWRLSSLSGALLSYMKTSLLINKWYALQPTINRETGRVDKVAHEKAFINMITSAERKAREHARAAKIATGLVPVQAKIHYQAAVVLRERGDLTDKLRALELFWSSSMYSQASMMLARNPYRKKPANRHAKSTPAHGSKK